VSLLVVVALAAGCGSGGHKSVAAKPAPARSTPTPTAVNRIVGPRPTATVPAAHNKAPSSAAAKLLAGKIVPLRRQTNAANAAAAAARRSAARNPANRTCKLALRGRTVPVACGLQRPLQQALGHNPALAGLLGAAARSR
jgi:hypothetical protein